MKYLCEVTEKYRIDTETEAKAFIEEQKADSKYSLKKYASEQTNQLPSSLFLQKHMYEFLVNNDDCTFCKNEWNRYKGEIE